MTDQAPRPSSKMSTPAKKALPGRTRSAPVALAVLTKQVRVLRRAGLLALRHILGPNAMAMTVNDPDLIEAVESLGLGRRFTANDLRSALASSDSGEGEKK